MSFYRMRYEGYMEQEFDSLEDALEGFVDHLHEIEDGDYNILTERWDEDNQEWEVV